MAVGLEKPSKLLPVNGVRLSSAAAGIRHVDRNDVVLIEFAPDTVVSAVFTQNAFCAAPVQLAKSHLAKMPARWLLINAGNANAGTGEAGLSDAMTCCAAVAEQFEASVEQVLPFSTGVIGERLPSERLIEVIPALKDKLSASGWEEAAHAMLTTDTVAKGISEQVQIDGNTVTITGIAKGSGMIRPDMATMLAYIATDAAVEQAAMDRCLEQAVNGSFNRITIDGDTSTNDACVLAATGTVNDTVLNAEHVDFEILCDAVQRVCRWLAQAIVRDGEGATKFITINVEGGSDSEECLAVAYTIAHSPLVKTAFFASDPNWGRILAAVGRAPVLDFDLSLVDILLDDVCIVRQGEPATDYTEQAGQAVMNQSEITVHVRLGRGGSVEQIWTSDLSYDYVRINAEYRS
ncbi:MAG TPA: bifunctional glutamate N-acetyltransferase/amino-acid acetyltransferase ArgJ [Gammaproteobacteria bacterium]|nr:bifunctional glutamate N-acetyltransferase/amino-acid acetyltransferase ArgJ [Gammaproteobacteria bacterium]